MKKWGKFFAAWKALLEIADIKSYNDGFRVK